MLSIFGGEPELFHVVHRTICSAVQLFTMQSSLSFTTYTRKRPGRVVVNFQFIQCSRASFVSVNAASKLLPVPRVFNLVSGQVAAESVFQRSR